MPQDATDKADLLYGLPAIGKHMNLTTRQAKHLAEKAGLPVFRLTSTVCARRADIDEWLAKQAAAARAPEPASPDIGHNGGPPIGDGGSEGA
jgi:hypothetical protein